MPNRKRKMKPKNFYAEQMRLLRGMQNASMRVMFGISAENPTVRLLRGRSRGADRLSSLADYLASSVWQQYDERLEKLKN